MNGNFEEIKASWEENVIHIVSELDSNPLEISRRLFYSPCLSPGGEAEVSAVFSHRPQEGCDCTHLKSQSEPTWFYKETRKKQAPFRGSAAPCNSTTRQLSCSAVPQQGLCRMRPPRGQEHRGPRDGRADPARKGAGWGQHGPGDTDGTGMALYVGLWGAHGQAGLWGLEPRGADLGRWGLVVPSGPWHFRIKYQENKSYICLVS